MEMEKELTKYELEDQLVRIEEKEKELKEELFYRKYSDLTYFQIWKICNNWKSIIINCIVIDLIFLLLNYKLILWFMFIFPALFFIASLSNALEIKNRIIYIKKKRTN